MITSDVTATELAKAAHKSLSQEKTEWLKARGISGGSIRRFCLGQVSTKFLQHIGHSEAIVIPYILQRKPLLVKKIRFRMFSGNAKYLDLPGEKVHLFNLQPTLIKFGEPTVYLCEGEFDTIILEQLGYPAIGVPGTSSFNGNWKYLFLEHKVVLVFDGDDAGHTGSNRIKSILGSVNKNIRQVWLPDGKDITDVYLMPKGKQTLQELLD